MELDDTQQAFYELVPHLVDTTVSEEGIIEYSNRRFVYFRTRMFAALFEQMKDVTGPVIESRIKEFGKAAGNDIAAKMDATFKEVSTLDAVELLIRSRFNIGALRRVSAGDDLSMLKKIFGYGTYVGWNGPVNVVEYVEGEQAVIKTRNLFEAESYGETGNTECTFIPGVLCGMLSYYWDREDLMAYEKTCTCAGDQYCTIVIEQTEEDT